MKSKSKVQVTELDSILQDHAKIFFFGEGVFVCFGGLVVDFF